jgi:hypothetical protein
MAVIPGESKRTRKSCKVSKHNGARKPLLSQRCKSYAFALLILLNYRSFCIVIPAKEEHKVKLFSAIHFKPYLNQLPELFERLQIYIHVLFLDTTNSFMYSTVQLSRIIGLRNWK